jgi:hypothetical protein
VDSGVAAVVRSNPLPPLLPQLSPEDREGGSHPRRSVRSRPPLRLPQLPEAPHPDVVFAMSRLDYCGRLSCRIVLTALEWSPAYQCDFSIGDGVIVIRADPGGVRAISERCLLQLPVPHRRAYRLQPGDPILLAALPVRQCLVVYPPATLATLTADVHERVAGGEPA